MRTMYAVLAAMALLVSGTLVRAQRTEQSVPSEDARNTILTSRTHYKMPAFATREAWLERATFLRKQILASAGLLPMPEKRPLNPQVFGLLERDGYTIEKVLLETMPGFYLGGNLYRPRGLTGPFRPTTRRLDRWSTRVGCATCRDSPGTRPAASSSRPSTAPAGSRTSGSARSTTS